MFSTTVKPNGKDIYLNLEMISEIFWEEGEMVVVMSNGNRYVIDNEYAEDSLMEELGIE